ncbi:hypothetical protein ACFWXK_13065 [Streptomyces sp. NPDC059070]|uniref:hypothetical protein n=1 Tax=Streptomyces sp. NPDC059070 TaxID=3346713 RepID=UPI0036C02DEE
MKPYAEEGRAATEDRLRAALAARAALVTHHDLRPAEPPQGRDWGARRVRRIAFTALAVAAAVVAVCLLVRPGGAPGPVPPAHRPGVEEPPAPPRPVDPSGTDPRVVVRP